MRLFVDGHSLGERKGGNETYVLGLLSGLRLVQARLSLVVGVGAAAEMAREHDPGDGPRPVTVEYRRLEARSRVSRLALEVPRILRKGAFDAALFQYMGPPSSSCPMVLAVHDASFRTHPGSLDWRDALRLRVASRLWAFPRAAAVVVPSLYTAGALRRAYPRLGERIHVVPLAAGDDFSPREEASDGEVMESLGLPERYLLYVGRRDRRKRVDRLLEIYQAVAASRREVPPLVLVGPASAEDPRLEQKSRRLGISGRVRVLDYVDRSDLPALYRGASLFLFTGVAEGFGLPVLEAMASGVPVIVADDGALPEVVGTSGLVISIHDTKAWVQATRAVLDTPEKAAELGRNGTRRARGFRWCVTAEETLRVLESVSARGSRRPG